MLLTILYQPILSRLHLMKNNPTSLLISLAVQWQFYFHNNVKTTKTVKTKLTIAPEQCGKLMAKLQESSSHFQRTGGVHNVALCTTDVFYPERILAGIMP